MTMAVGIKRAKWLVGSICAMLAATGCSSSGSTTGGGGDAGDASADGVAVDATSGDATATDGAESDASACAGGQMSCGGSCVDTSNDPGNCGSCGNKCATGDVCSNGQCSLSCGGGSIQCGTTCTDPNVDPGNCGACGHACPTGQLCSAGQCATQCGGGLSMCSGGAADGGAIALCVNEQNDPQNCGGCGKVCPAGEACNAGTCSVSCPGTEVNCNGLCIDPSTDDQYCGATGACGVGDAGSAGTQCAAGQVCNGGSCSVSCPGNEVNCNGECIDPTSDPGHCGATAGCGVGDAGSAGGACPAGQVCGNGQCVVSCPGNEINCNGTCIDPTSNNQYCGASAGCGVGDAGTAGTTCPAGQVCGNGQCAVSCPGNQIDCNGTCIDPTSNNQYCGASAGCGSGDAGTAGTTCPAGQVCGNGQCAVSCPGNEINCNGTCIDPTSNTLYCGATAGCGVADAGTSGTTCPAGQMCGNGQCVVSCPGNEIDCNGTCIDPTSNNQYCGATAGCGAGDAGTAGTTCPAGQVCGNGQCAVSCPGNQINCGGTCIDPTSNSQYCGATAGCGLDDAGTAGTTCPAGQVCGNSQCAVSCPGMEINCNGTCIDPTNSNQYCGATAGCGVGGNGSKGTSCAAGQVCAMSSCAVSCPSNEIGCNGTCIDPTSNNQYCGATAGCGLADAGSAGTPCAPGQACAKSQCTYSCPGNQINCNGACIDPTTNGAHCGAPAGCGAGDAGSGGTACGAGETCTGGACIASCGTGLTTCNLACVNEQSDPSNCGACGHVCGPYANGAAYCSLGVCTEVCNAGYADCSGTGTGGCSTNIETDNNNCGACGSVCPTTALGKICQAGSCYDPPPAANFGAAAGGDGWAVALNWTQVFNVFHHQEYLGISCHNQIDASTCTGYPKTVTDASGAAFYTSGQPGLYIDPITNDVYVPATHPSDNTSGVVCINTTTANANPFCGYTPLTPAGQGPPNSSGWSGLSNPVQVGTKWYMFNYVNGIAVGTEDELLCFDLTTKAACAGQPFSVALGASSFTLGAPSPSVAVIGNQIIVPITPSTSGSTTLGCYNPTVAGGACGGSWPVATGVAYASNYGTAIPMLNGTSGAATGLCLPTGTDPCFTLAGASTATPANYTSVIIASDAWNGPAVVVGTRVYVPNGTFNGSVGGVECFDYSTNALCAGFPNPKTFSNLGYLYTVNQDPHRPFCLWVNSDNGADQIQDFDPTTGGACP